MCLLIIACENIHNHFSKEMVYFAIIKNKYSKGGIMESGKEKEPLQQMREWVHEMVDACQDIVLLDLIYKMLVIK